ncbi:MAG: crossover junction endodeoxyribonuclease RuvC [Spirochaetaceae bacterium]|nr:crossover junction endodeoxyribonuclease RuvC [Spirochaetaceae bacterium]
MFYTDPMLILGIDPGLASTGWGVIDSDGTRFRLISYGCIETDSKQNHSLRLLEIYNKILAVINEFKPDQASMETLYFAKNVTSALGVSEARGVVSMCLAQNAIPLTEYSPNTIKQSVSGTATADKSLVQRCVKMLLGLQEIPKPDHAADAIAAAITHVNSTGLTRLKSNLSLK